MLRRFKTKDGWVTFHAKKRSAKTGRRWSKLADRSKKARTRRGNLFRAVKAKKSRRGRPKLGTCLHCGATAMSLNKHGRLMAHGTKWTGYPHKSCPGRDEYPRPGSEIY